VSIARACIRAGARGRFHTAIDPVNQSWRPKPAPDSRAVSPSGFTR
jgi:hypothetical protein